ncbi:9117_t:CDS:2 [Ambispora leptoticha]|uniref:9117_t:CDS:1 n=1 Tax=Ambispora leptoticha TaxID=144679 RepID=A0A9N9IWV6_9GLOM|nr:9117_t:CDS:2 [Ambispora leptoticha]
MSWRALVFNLYILMASQPDNLPDWAIRNKYGDDDDDDEKKEEEEKEEDEEDKLEVDEDEGSGDDSE